MICQKCGEKNEKNTLFCISCGKSLDKPVFSSSRKWLLSGILVCLILLIGVSYLLLQAWSENKVRLAEVNREPVQSEAIVEKKIENIKPIVSNLSEKDKTTIIKEATTKVFTIFTEESFGSGFLYKKGGLIITNAHVVAGYTDVVIRNSTGENTDGKVIGISDRYDIALIQVNEYADEEPLPIEVNESNVGSEVIAIGSPLGFENTASVGYLTGIGRNIEYGFTYENVYQIDALIDQGSSGGPLLDAKTGKVIGINSLLYTGNNSFGFSIPMYSMMNLVDSWSNNPMNEYEVASLFPVYDDYVYYDENVNNKANSYYEEYYTDNHYDAYIEEDYEEELVEDYYEYYEEESEIETVFDEYSLEDFILVFRESYEYALNVEDFYWIEDMLLPGSTAYTELENYIAEISNQGMTFSFTSNTITGISFNEETAIVTTFEEFDFISANGELSNYEKVKDYHLVIDDFGEYKITAIDIYD